MPETDRLEQLAEAVADARPPDWTALEAAAASADERDALAAFRSLADLGDAFASAARTAGTSAGPRLQLAPGATWGSLEIVEHVGRGRFGDVYRAWDSALNRHVALKLVNEDAEISGATAQVVEEGRLMARVRHPNVVTVHGAQRIAGTTGIWMELVEGRTLEEELAERGPLTPEEVAEVGRELAGALASVHAAGLVHRDVKASNVLRDTSGRIVLGDFGTGSDLDEADTSREGLVGTPAYLAPEIFERRPATQQSDIYSLGVLLFRLATGGYPLEARTLGALRDAHARGLTRSIGDVRPDLPTGLVAVVDTALQIDPSGRFASAAAMAGAFERLQRRQQPVARRTVLTIVGAALVVATGWLAWSSRPAPLAFAERDWVLVAAFDNRTGNPLLDGATEYALEMALGNSQVVNVVPRERVEDTLSLMRRPLDTRLDERTAHEVALRDGGIRAVLAGRIDSVGQTYRLTARVSNPVDGALVATFGETAAGEADVLAALGRLAASVRTRLSEALPKLPGVSESLPPRVTTQSLKALGLYQRALPELPADANPRLAEQLLTEAVREDPDFAVAHVALASAIFAQRFPSGERNADFRAADVDHYLERARVASEHVSPQDRFRVTIRTAAIQQLRTTSAERAAYRQQARAALEALDKLTPDDQWVVQELLRLEDGGAERVMPLVRRLVALRPNSLEVLAQVAYRSVSVGEFDAARSYLARARPLLDLPVSGRAGDGPSVDARILMFEDAWSRDDIDAAYALANELLAISQRSTPEAASLYGEALSLVFVALGQLDRAEAVASAMLRPGMRELRVGSVVFSRRDRDRARAYLDEYGIESSFRSAEAFNPMFVLAGRLTELRKAVAGMRKLPRMPAGTLATEEARLSLAEGQPQRAIELLEPLMTKGPLLVQSNLLADAWISAGSPADAIRVLERAAAVPREMRRPSIFGGMHHWLDQQDRLARLYREVGRVDEAPPLERRLRVLLRFADNDHPIRRRLGNSANE